jgi:hypothetical protein
MDPSFQLRRGERASTEAYDPGRSTRVHRDAGRWTRPDRVLGPWTAPRRGSGYGWARWLIGWVFLAITAWWLVATTVDIDLPSAGWFLAGLLVVLGLLGLYVAVKPVRT